VSSSKIKLLLFIFFLSYIPAIAQKAEEKNGEALSFFKASHPYIQYTGRIDFSDPAKPKFWSPGVYITAKFKGPFCEVVINDEVLWGTSHNYIEIVVDDGTPYRIQTTGKENFIKVGEGLSNKEHTVTICKNTESGIGYLEFIGFRCKALLPSPARPIRKIEFIGNSITCGMGSDLSVTPCDKGQWYDQHNAYMSYGPTTARSLKAQWQLTAVSGIGLIHSCCNMTVTMPQVFDKVNLRTDSIAWNFKKYQPDVVTICLGQNDGIQDSATFCKAYLNFIQTIRQYYPKATIICLNSPMADERLTTVLKKYITAVVYTANRNDKNVYPYFFSKRYYKGCGDHPNLEEHEQMAKELSAYIKKIKKW
jgi:lysophospholipase L1-like esterase